MNVNISTPGLALYSLPVIWASAFYPNFARVRVMKKNMGGYSNVKPRDNMNILKDSHQLDASMRDRIARMVGAHQNGMENLPIWFSAVLAGYIAGLPHRTMNMFAAGYVAFRLLYNYIYFNQTTESQGFTRTLTFFAGLSLPITLMIKSANKLSRSTF